MIAEYNYLSSIINVGFTNGKMVIFALKSLRNTNFPAACLLVCLINLVSPGQSRLSKKFATIDRPAINQRDNGSMIDTPEPSLYPRPSETRNVISLNGVYEFCLDGEQVGMQNDWFNKHLEDSCQEHDLFRMPVPSSYNDITPFKRVRDHIGWVWYQTTINYPCWLSPQELSSRLNRIYLLRFDSVNYEAIVWLNAKKLGTHIGGHLPFSFQLSDSDLCGDDSTNRNKINKLTIAVNNNLTMHTIPSGHIKQIRLSNGKLVQHFTPDFDFFNYAGILRDVRLYTVPEMYISDISTSMSLDEGESPSSRSLYVDKLHDSQNSIVPKLGLINYKLKVSLSSRLITWTNALSLLVRLRDKTNMELVVNKTETIIEIIYLHEWNSDPNRGYFELQGEISIDRPRLWHPYPGLVNYAKTGKSGKFDTCTRQKMLDDEQLSSDRLNYRANLYNIEFEVKITGHQTGACGVSAQAIKDVYSLNIGFKSVEISTKDGPFLFNKRPVYLKGFGKHEEQLIRGRSMDLAALMKDVYLIKWTGANVIRTSHYPYSEEFLDEMDAHGIMVIDECPAVGLNYFDENKLKLHQKIMSELIHRDKNRASVIMWSLANEPRSDLIESDNYFKQLVEFTKKIQFFNKLPLTGAIAQEFDDDHFGQYLDVLMINRYYGWYEDTGYADQIYDKLKEDLQNWIEKFKLPLMVSEYGADSLAGLHRLPEVVFSEEFQIELMKENHRVFDYLHTNATIASEYFIGEMIWNFADFQTNQGLTRVGGNKKGVFTQDRQPKMAAHAIRSRYCSLPN